MKTDKLITKYIDKTLLSRAGILYFFLVALYGFRGLVSATYIALTSILILCLVSGEYVVVISFSLFLFLALR
ncbi:MAG: hypothetical protein ACI9XO_004647 [Paraglaciecola sp.]|jgi:hypothetical protein